MKIHFTKTAPGPNMRLIPYGSHMKTCLKKAAVALMSALVAFLFMLSCSSGDEEKSNPAVTVHDEQGNDVSDNSPSEKDTPINYKSLIGKWSLIYGGNYGYTFRFQNNYKSLVTLYLGNEALVFKGVYSIEGKNLVINIYEMKRAKDIASASYPGGFQKANSSSFIFRASMNEKNRKKILKIVPVKIRIDGNNSDGYFEPLIKLSND